MLRVGDLFSGIGGFSLGLECTGGFTTQWFVENDPYCQRVLAKHWPHVQRYGDIQSVDWGTVEPVDVLCGGFPCQDISLAGKGAGLAGERSGLWFEYAKAIEALTPRYVIIENVAALRSRGLDQVLGSLAALGYDAEWHCIPASAVGAPHRRDRVWIVAYPIGSRQLQPQGMQSDERGWAGNESQEQYERVMREWDGFEGEWSEDVADAYAEGLEGHRTECELGEGSQEIKIDGGSNVADASEQQRDRWLRWTCGWEREPQEALRDAGGRGREKTWMSIPESLLGRVAHGIPHRVDRLRGLGNAIVPQIAEWLGRQIMSSEQA